MESILAFPYANNYNNHVLGGAAMNKLQSTRNPSMDLIRCVALLCVISVHFFLNSGFYGITISGIFMYLMILLRACFMVCVSLFMILSGYLLRFKKPTRTYYKRITKTLVIYFLAAVLCILYRNIEGSNPLGISLSVLSILDFTGAPYAWYIEMYIGLFLLIPFLNVTYNNLENQKIKQLLILSMLLLTAIPDVVNIWRILDPHWWVQPSYNPSYYELMPNWWVNIYPITYYFIGCYLNEYPVNIRRSVNLGTLVLVIFAGATFSYYRSYNAPFVSGIWQSYSSIITVVQSVLIFVFLANIDLRKLPATAQKWLSRISGWCMGAYLVSWIFDQIFYKILHKYAPTLEEKIKYFIIIVPAVYICSLVLSALLNTAYDFIAKILHRFMAKKEKVQ